MSRERAPWPGGSSRISTKWSKRNIFWSLSNIEKSIIVSEITRSLKIPYDCGKKLLTTSYRSGSLTITIFGTFQVTHVLGVPWQQTKRGDTGPRRQAVTTWKSGQMPRLWVFDVLFSPEFYSQESRILYKKRVKFHPLWNQFVTSLLFNF